METWTRTCGPGGFILTHTQVAFWRNRWIPLVNDSPPFFCKPTKKGHLCFQSASKKPGRLRSVRDAIGMRWNDREINHPTGDFFCPTFPTEHQQAWFRNPVQAGAVYQNLVFGSPNQSVPKTERRKGHGCVFV